MNECFEINRLFYTLGMLFYTFEQFNSTNL